MMLSYDELQIQVDQTMFADCTLSKADLSW